MIASTTATTASTAELPEMRITRRVGSGEGAVTAVPYRPPGLAGRRA